MPFLSLRPVHEGLTEPILRSIKDLMETGAFTNGPAVAEFEQAFARYCGRTHCVGVSSGLDALRLALIASGLERGDRVLVPAQTFVATFEAVTQSGGIPVPVDVSEEDYNLDPAAVAVAVDERTRFMVPVHLYGQLADMNALDGIARRNEIVIVEDAAQAHGARRDGWGVGGGKAAAFSFYPGKNLGAIGDAGALVTDDARLADTATALREHGQIAKYCHAYEGWTARLDTIQAIVLLHKLPLLDAWNDERRSIAAAYSDLLRGVGDLRLPSVARRSEPVWHLYVVRTGQRDDLAAFLRDRGIQTGVHYPDPPPFVPPYAHLGYPRGSFPVAEALAAEALSLPIFPGMTEAQIVSVTSAIAAFYSRA